MKVKRKGNPKIWEREVECSNCGALLTVSAEDIYVIRSVKRGIVSEKKIVTCFNTKCKECETTIQFDKIPRLVGEYIIDLTADFAKGYLDEL